MRPRFVVRRSSKPGSIRTGTCTDESPANASETCDFGGETRPRSAAVLLRSTPYHDISSRDRGDKSPTGCRGDKYWEEFPWSRCQTNGWEEWKILRCDTAPQSLRSSSRRHA